MNRLWLLLGFAGVIALALWQYGRRADSATTAATAASSGSEPGYVALGAELYDTGANGQPLYRLRAPRIEQAAPSADIELITPEFRYQGPTNWLLTAQHGSLPPAANRVDLRGNVVALGQRPASADLRIRTDNLTVDLDQQRLDTLAAVAIDWGPNRLSSVGLHADMNADSLRLESRVHGEFKH